MTYREVLLSCINPNDVTAILYGDNIESSFVKITLGNSQSILQYLEKSDGQAMSIKLRNVPYWILTSSCNSNCLLFRGPNGNKQFNHAIESDFEIIEYLKTL